MVNKMVNKMINKMVNKMVNKLFTNNNNFILLLFCYRLM